MITYVGLARCVAAAIRVLTPRLHTGHVALLALGHVRQELNNLAAQEEAATRVTMRPAYGLGDRSLWLHSCGTVLLGDSGSNLPPAHCVTCPTTQGWERLYVSLVKQPA
jgi:hypothetical protein